MIQLDINNDLESLQLKASLIIRDMQFSHENAQKLKELILAENMDTVDFIREFNAIVRTSKSHHWKIAILLNNLKERYIHELELISWTPIILICLGLILLLFLIKKFKLKKVIKKSIRKFFKISLNLIERIGALFAYFVPLVSIYAAYVPRLIGSYPYLNFIFPEFLRDSVDFYIRYPWVFNYIYFFGMMYGVMLFKKPKPRFIRFHLVRGLMLFAFQGIPDACVKAFQSSESLTQDQIVSTNLCLFAINLSWILPCIYQAITHTYPRSSFIRDAVEINVGRDKDDGFKWWNR
uniref:Conserved hypothetical chloroplast protein n=1 Tax=Vaucheria litorea TaxID=109269 RepID=B7T204_VAULI|nr:conserved hypothetical chloroplast protein [Vaucheria litorea]ACF70970.1 conserved hypothetical chloroplast protein [Vaucheria litorea]